MLDKVRVAMIGAGSMANSVHYPSLASFDDVEITAICELDPDRLTATRAAKIFSVSRPWYSCAF